MKKYRVITNGLCYKVQQRQSIRILWWTIRWWGAATHDREGDPFLYANPHEAFRDMKELQEKDRKRHPWCVIDEEALPQ